MEILISGFWEQPSGKFDGKSSFLMQTLFSDGQNHRKHQTHVFHNGLLLLDSMKIILRSPFRKFVHEIKNHALVFLMQKERKKMKKTKNM